MAAQGIPADFLFFYNDPGNLFNQIHPGRQQICDPLLLHGDNLLNGAVQQPHGQVIDADYTETGEPGGNDLFGQLNRLFEIVQ